VTRTGGPSRSAMSDACKNGSQNLRTNSPMGVPRPTRVNRSFSSALSMILLLNGTPAVGENDGYV
jgi:hypothetical protein